jgi:hypothetical protein
MGNRVSHLIKGNFDHLCTAFGKVERVAAEYTIKGISDN